MKRTRKRLLSLLLCICMVAGLLPVTAGAAAATTVQVGGVELNSTTTYAVTDNSGTVTTADASSSNWNIKFENGTLTLKGATIAAAYTGDDGKTYGIYADGDLTLVLENASTVQNTDTAFNYGVYINGSLTVSGTGSLTAGGAGENSYGVYVGGALTVQSGSITGSNTSTDYDDYGDGIYVGNALTVAGGTVTGSGKSKSSKLNGAGIHVYAGGLTVTAGSVTGTAAGERSEGIYVKQGNLAVSGSGSVTGYGSGQWCQGIRLEKGNLEVSGGTVTGTATGANGQGYGIYMYYGCDLNVTGGSVTGNGCGQSGYGIIVENRMTVEGGTVTGTCSDLYGTGIGAAQGLTVSGSGSVTGSGQSGYGIRAYNGDIHITGTGTYVKGTSQIPEYAIYVGTKYALYVNEVRYEPSSVTEFKVENGQVTGAIEWTGSGNVWVNGVKITGDPNYTVTCGDGTAVYAPDTSTLTLTNATIDASYEDVDGTYGIYAEGDLILVLEGSSTVKSSDKAFDCSVCIGGDLTVKGGGTLTVNGSGCGIYASNMTVESGSVTGTSTGSNSYGIGVRNVLTVQGGSVTGTGTGSSSYGIDVFKDALTVSGGTVTGTGKKAGIYLEKNALKVSGGTVTGEGTNYGIYVPTGTLTVSGSGSVSGTATGNGGDGIFTGYSLTVNGGDVTGTATSDGGWGINVDASSLTVNGGSVTGNGDSTGIYTGYGLTVNGGDVTGTATSEGSCGIDTTTLNMTGGIVTGKGAGVAIVTYGDGEKTADNLISVPANYVPSGYGAQAVVVQDNGNTFTYASFAETGKELAYDKDSGFTNAATEITLKAPGAVSFPQQFYASINFDPSYGYKHFGRVTQSGDSLTYTEIGDVTDRTIYGMESAGGAIFTVESDDDSEWMLRVYSSDLATFRTIGRVTNQAGDVDYAIVDTAMDLSGTEPALYGTYQGYAYTGTGFVYCSYICQISLTDGTTSNYLQVAGDLPNTDIVYAIAFDKNGTLYAIGADMGDDGGPASLYTIDLDNASSGQVSAKLVGAIKDGSGNTISTNYTQDLAYDYNTGTLYWMENAKEVLYTVDAASAVATRVGQVKHSDPPYLPQAYSVSAFCILDDTPATSGNKHMVSVIYDENATVTKQGESTPAAAVYMLDDNASLTLKITPDSDLGLWYVKVDGRKIEINDRMAPMEYTFNNVTADHVIEVASRVPINVEQNTWDWSHYQGEPVSFYTQHPNYKFYDLPYLDTEVPREGYTQTLLDENKEPIDDNEIILPGNYDAHVTHPGTEKYAPLDVTYEDALQLAKCPGTPGRPVVYGKVGCTQGDLATTSALQDYYGGDGELIDAAHDEIPVTLVWQDPEKQYTEPGYFLDGSAIIYAADELDQRLLDCYNLDDGTPLTGGCQISSRDTQVIVLPADEASIIRLEASDAAGGTVSGKGVYKNDDEVTVTATPNTNAGYVFWGWQDENGQIISGADATYTFTASVDRTLTAVFVMDPEYLVILTTEGEDGCGTVTGGGNYKEDEHSATVTATANAGYYFIGWYAGEEQKSTKTSYTFPVPQAGITLTAKFGIDYLTKAEQAKTSFESAVGSNALSWAALEQAVEAYKAADEFVNDNPPSVIQDAATRFNNLTTYYNGVDTLDLSGQNLSDADLEELDFFTGLTDLNLSSTGISDLSGLTDLTTLETLNLSNNKGITGLSDLSSLENLKTLDISNTGVTTMNDLVSGGALACPALETLTAKNLSLSSIKALAELVSDESFNAESITNWDFSGSTLPDTEESKNDMETIKTKLDNKFSPPTIKTTPTGGGGGGGGGGGTVTYAVSVPEAITGGSLTVSPEKAAKGSTVTVTVKPDEGYELDALTVTDSKGNQVELTHKGDGKFTFKMPAAKVEIHVSFLEIPEPVTNPFTDVHESDYYYDAVLWAVEHDITNGTNAAGTLFSPDVTVTRAQMVTFLWRAYGAPEATGENPFADVDEDAWYYDAVLWAVANGVTNGTSDTTFSPDDTCTRAQAVTFQWRAANTPAATGSTFDDVPEDTWYTDSVTWAVANGITVGTNESGTLFSPDMDVSRAQAVTFLYRELA